MLRTLFICSILMLSACETLPRDAFRLSESALAIREMQTREYESVTDEQILFASVAVLQDMGYTVDEIESRLGVLSASKRADATNTFRAVGTYALDGVTCVLTLGVGCDGRHSGKIDDVQDIRVTLVSRPQLGNSEDVIVRITIQRVVWDKNGQISRQETITDGQDYALMFQMVSKAVFLEREGF